ncbi:hypothetical protein [Candidatus Poriferisodalis sp.]|uniref:hypothetical protein n=1 Tax=Candidatus Poriferisodalis sp. TaxID=3101277 RepID=UPI003B01F76A
MPTWGEQIRELRDLKQAAHKSPKPGDPSPHDLLRRKYLKALSKHTGRATIFYGTCWLENKPVPNGDSLSLNLGDKQGFMEAVSNISERSLDLILTSPGGSPEAAEAIMGYLRSLLPGLIAQCIHSREQAERFVAEQLEAHMLNGDHAKSEAVAAWFADFSEFKSHGRPVTISDALAQGLKVTPLEDDQVLQDLVLSVHHAVRHTFNDTGTTKLIENHHGRAYLEMTGQVLVQQGQPGPQLPVGGQPTPNREQRRQNQRSGNQKGRGR